VTYGDIRLEEEPCSFSVFYNFRGRADVGEGCGEHLAAYEAGVARPLLDEISPGPFKAEKTAGERHDKIHDRWLHDGAATPAE